MAIPIYTGRISYQDGSVAQWTWTLTTADPNGVAIEMPEWADRNFQVGISTDTFGSATCSIQGSNDGITFSTLSNAAGATTATFTAAGFKTIIELPRFMRPSLTAVGVGATITCILVARRANPLRT